MCRLKGSSEKNKSMALSPKGLWRGWEDSASQLGLPSSWPIDRNPPEVSAQRKHLSIHVGVQKNLTPSASTWTFLGCLQSVCKCRKDHTQGLISDWPSHTFWCSYTLVLTQIPFLLLGIHTGTGQRPEASCLKHGMGEGRVNWGGVAGIASW